MILKLNQIEKHIKFYLVKLEIKQDNHNNDKNNSSVTVTDSTTKV